jgi:hypothetical protein
MQFRLLPLLLTGLLISCGSDPAETAAAPVCATSPTWHQDVQPIFAEYCTTCHQPGAIAQNRPWTSYAEAQPWAALIGQTVSDRQMPPFIAGDTPDCEVRYPFLHDTRLDDETIAVLVAWAECGTQEGEAEAGGEVTVDMPEVDLVGWQVEAAPFDGYAPTRGDRSICWSLPVPASWFEAEQDEIFVDAMQIVPGDLTSAHHVLVQFHESNLDDWDNDGVQDGRWDCTGAGLYNGIDVGGWLPGAVPVELPTGAGLPLRRDSRIGLQVHYHVVDDFPHFDLTRLRFRLSDPPTYETLIYRAGNAQSEAEGLLTGPNDLIGGVQFMIPAGAANHTEEMVFDVLGAPGTEFTAFLVSNHMHQVGVDMRMWVEHDPATIEPGEPVRECLLATPRYSFDWQGFFYFDAASGQAPKLRPGDQVRIRCTYDNTVDNLFWMDALETEGLPRQPIDVRYGFSSVDEMCVGLVGAVKFDTE